MVVLWCLYSFWATRYRAMHRGFPRTRQGREEEGEQHHHDKPPNKRKRPHAMASSGSSDTPSSSSAKAKAAAKPAISRANNTPFPKYRIDLDFPPRLRWVEVATIHRSTLRDLFIAYEEAALTLALGAMAGPDDKDDQLATLEGKQKWAQALVAKMMDSGSTLFASTDYVGLLGFPILTLMRVSVIIIAGKAPTISNVIIVDGGG